MLNTGHVSIQKINSLVQDFAVFLLAYHNCSSLSLSFSLLRCPLVQFLFVPGDVFPFFSHMIYCLIMKTMSNIQHGLRVVVWQVINGRNGPFVWELVNSLLCWFTHTCTPRIDGRIYLWCWLNTQLWYHSKGIMYTASWPITEQLNN